MDGIRLGFRLCWGQLGLGLVNVDRIKKTSTVNGFKNQSSSIEQSCIHLDSLNRLFLNLNN